LDVIDLPSGQVGSVAAVPGIARGLALHAGHAFVGLSKPRPSLQDVPIVERRETLQCGLCVIDLASGSTVAALEFQRGVEEVFDVQVLPDVTFPYISGPDAERDTGKPLWTVPPGGTK
jgi:uncharacterized protein (TIGR03032 family)